MITAIIEVTIFNNVTNIIIMYLVADIFWAKGRE